MNWKKIIVNLLIIIFTYSIMLFPWMLRNKENFGVWGLAGEGYANVFHYYVPDFLSSKEGISVETARNKLTADLTAKIGAKQAQDIGSLTNSGAVEAVAFKYIMADLFSYGEFQLIKMTPFFLSSGMKNFFVSYNDMLGWSAFPTNDGNMTDLLSHGKFGQFVQEIQIQPWVTLEEMYWVIIAMFMALGVIFSKNKLYAISFVLIIFYFAILTSSIAYSRFRLPALPFMLLLASSGFFILKNKLFSRTM